MVTVFCSIHHGKTLHISHNFEKSFSLNITVNFHVSLLKHTKYTSTNPLLLRDDSMALVKTDDAV